METLDAEFPKQCQDMAKAGKRWPKAEKGLDKDDSLYIFETTGVFVAVGSGNIHIVLESSSQLYKGWITLSSRQILFQWMESKQK